MITHVHTVVFLCPLSCSAGLGVCNDHKDSLLALLPALDPCPGLFSAGLCYFLSYPKSGLHSLPLAPAAQSLTLLHPESITWTSQPELERVRMSKSSQNSESCDVLLATHPHPSGKFGSSQEDGIGLTEQQATINGKLSHARDIPQQRGHGSSAEGCSPGHVSLCCPSATLKVLAPRCRPWRREAACRAAAESA